MKEESDRTWMDNAILVYGPRKAGTTLFQNLLDGSDDLMVYPTELKLKEFIRHRWGSPQDVDRYVASSRIVGVDSPRISQEKYARQWQAFADDVQGNSLASLIRHDLRAVRAAADGVAAHPVAWVAKEVGSPSHQIIELWRELFPMSKVIFIVREPAMITRAVLNDRRRTSRRLSLRQIAHQTIDPLRVLRAQSELMGEPWSLTVRYEDVVARTASTMRRVTKFLGVPYSPIFERPTLFGEDVVVRTASRPTPGIFQPETDWRDGLTPRERRTVSLTRAVARLLPGLRVDYENLAARVTSGN